MTRKLDNYWLCFCCLIILFCKIYQCSSRCLCLSIILSSSLLNALLDVKTATLLKRDPTGVFQCILQSFYLPILKDICKQLLLNFLNGSLLHGPKGLRSRLYGSFRLQGPSYSRFSFSF